MDFIISDQNGMEVDILKERQYIDVDIGGKNDFEIHISNDLYKNLGIIEGWRIGVPGKEYGGIIDKTKTMATNNQVVLSGPTWRGMLTKKIIEPPEGQDYKTVSGDAHTIINTLMCAEFDGIFVCSGASGITVDNYKFDRYVDTLAGVEKMLRSKNARINIAYDSGEPNAAGFIRLSAVPIHDYSDELEYSQDGTLSFLSFTFERYAGGINHLICLGKGNLKDRLVIHLYVQKDGSIGNTKYYTGKDERTSVYDYSSCESAEELQEKGIEKLKEMMSYTDMDMDLLDPSLSGLKGLSADVAIGDIVGGRDWTNNIYLSKQITRKIVQVKNGRESINYKVGGNTLNRSTANAPAEPEDVYQGQIDALKRRLTDIGKVLYPVGSVFITTTNNNPQTFLGGTWQAWGSGRVPIGVNVQDKDFDTAEKAGGAKTVNLAHAHTVNKHEHTMRHTHVVNAHNHLQTMGMDGAIWFSEAGSSGFNGSQVLTRPAGTKYVAARLTDLGIGVATGTGPLRYHRTGNAVPATGDASVANTSSASPGTNSNLSKTQSILQPYITCYMWKRTA